VPVKDVAEAAKQYVKVLETPEFRTTKLCAGCWREASKCGKSVRSIGCRSTECFGGAKRRGM